MSVPIRVRADFNGLVGDLLCLSHRETCIGAGDEPIAVHEGMILIAFDDDLDEEGKPDNLIASGVVEHAPSWLECKGSRWVLRIDKNGVRHESEVRDVIG